MKFNGYKDMYLRHKKFFPKEITQNFFYDSQLAACVESRDSGKYNNLLLEREWIRAGRPYYNVFPKIIPHLLKVNENNVPVESVQLPLRNLLLRFPENCPELSFEFKGQTYYLKTALLGQHLEASYLPQHVESILV